jgi:hypothetical protein
MANKDNSMKNIILLAVAMNILIGCVSNGQAGHQRIPKRSYYDAEVEVWIVDDRGQRFSSYPVQSSPRLQKTYIEARKHQPYHIEVINHSDERVGVVIAVDGRNIISGKHSKLRSKERMYILHPHQRQSFSGWRSGRDRINRFYFTNVDNAYAASFGDYSAMGVIGVAAFREYLPAGYGSDDHYYSNKDSSKSKRHSSRKSIGTGWGESEYSPSHKTEFYAEKRPFSTSLVKYERHETLCEKRIIDCYRSPNAPRNRMWDEDDDYAHPPGRHFKKYNEW